MALRARWRSRSCPRDLPSCAVDFRRCYAHDLSKACWLLSPQRLSEMLQRGWSRLWQSLLVTCCNSSYHDGPQLTVGNVAGLTRTLCKTIGSLVTMAGAEEDKLLHEQALLASADLSEDDRRRIKRRASNRFAHTLQCAVNAAMLRHHAHVPLSGAPEMSAQQWKASFAWKCSAAALLPLSNLAVVVPVPFAALAESLHGARGRSGR